MRRFSVAVYTRSKSSNLCPLSQRRAVDAASGLRLSPDLYQLHAALGQKGVVSAHLYKAKESKCRQHVAGERSKTLLTQTSYIPVSWDLDLQAALAIDSFQ